MRNIFRPVAVGAGRGIRALGDGLGALGSAFAKQISLTPIYVQHVRYLIKAIFRELVQKAYKGNSIIYALLRFLAQAVCEPPITVHFRETDGEIGDKVPWDHPLLRLIRKPNPLMTEWTFKWITTHHIGLVGTSLWFIERSLATNEPVYLWPIRPDRIGPIYSTKEEQAAFPVLRAWSYLAPGSTVYDPLEPADIIQFHFPDVGGESGGIVEGFGPTQVLVPEITADNSTTEYTATVLGNYGAPGMVIEYDRNLPNQEAADRIKAGVKADFAGKGQGSPMLLEKGMKAHPFGFSPRDLNAAELGDRPESRAASAFGIPPSLIGFLVGLKHSTQNATVQTYMSLFTRTTCTSYWRMMSDVLTEQLAPNFDPTGHLVVQFDMTRVWALREDELDRIEGAFERGALWIDEYREALGFQDVEDGSGKQFMSGIAPGRGTGSPVVWVTPNGVAPSSPNGASVPMPKKPGTVPTQLEAADALDGVRFYPVGGGLVVRRRARPRKVSRVDDLKQFLNDPAMRADDHQSPQDEIDAGTDLVTAELMTLMDEFMGAATNGHTHDHKTHS